MFGCQIAAWSLTKHTALTCNSQATIFDHFYGMNLSLWSRPQIQSRGTLGMPVSSSTSTAPVNTSWLLGCYCRMQSPMVSNTIDIFSLPEAYTGHCSASEASQQESFLVSLTPSPPHFPLSYVCARMKYCPISPPTSLLS